MATHSGVLAWRIPGTEEPGGLLSLGINVSETQKYDVEQKKKADYIW